MQLPCDVLCIELCVSCIVNFNNMLEWTSPTPLVCSTNESTFLDNNFLKHMESYSAPKLTQLELFGVEISHHDDDRILHILSHMLNTLCNILYFYSAMTITTLLQQETSQHLTTLKAKWLKFTYLKIIIILFMLTGLAFLWKFIYAVEL